MLRKSLSILLKGNAARRCRHILPVVLLCFTFSWIAASDKAERTWIGPNGTALPFTTEEEILDFLRTAEVASIESIPVGVTHPKKVLLEKDGIQMHAVFRYFELFKRRHETGGQVKMNYRDSYAYELAAYKLGRLLGMDNIPPTVMREINGEKGTVQAWVEGAMTETKRKKENLTPPDSQRWIRQFSVVWLFDNLIFNDDRNMGNILIDSDWNLWMIDATRAFRPLPDLKNPQLVRFCPINIWQRLNQVPDETIRETLSDCLGNPEIKTLLERRTKLIKYIQSVIDRVGEKNVLITL